jgi:hypothetical protein
MTESTARAVDASCKIAATLALLIGGIWTLYTYLNSRSQEARTNAIEAKKPFLAKRLEVYTELVNLSSQIASSDERQKSGSVEDKQEMKEQKIREQRFWELTSGLVDIVADRTVKQEASSFANCMGAFARVGREEENSCGTAWELSHSLVVECKYSISHEWQVNMSDMEIAEEKLERMKLWKAK